MEKSNKSRLLGTAVAGIIGAMSMVSTSFAGDKADKKKHAEKAEMEKCYGVNKCAGHGKCGGKGYSCAGQNKCAGQGWLEVPKGLCTELQGGSLTPVEKSQ